MSDVHVVILAAGKGTRMKSPRPKVLHPLCGRPMLSWVVDSALALEPARITLVVGEDSEAVVSAAREAAGPVALDQVVQSPQRGTGHALQIAAPSLGKAPGRVVVLYGDMPLLRPTSLKALIKSQAEAGEGASSLLTTWSDDPHGYGRILRDDEERFLGIVEERDATPEQREIGEINLGVYCFDGAGLLSALPRLEPNNAQGELYITDVAGMLVGEGRPLATVELEDEEEGRGVNTLAQLAEVRWAAQLRILERHMENGVLIEDPATTWIAHDVKIGSGTHILPCVYLHPGVVIGQECEVGPFTQLRPGTVLEDRAEVGNFTECKNTRLGRGSKAKHLSYLGDTEVGAGANIGAGTIFANYDGKKKWKTRVDDGAFVGSGTIVVAPGHLGARSVTGAGAVVTRNAPVGPDETWIGIPARKLQKRSKSEGAGESS